MASRTKTRAHSAPFVPAPVGPSKSARELFADAVRHHMAGESAAAEVAYREALLLDPGFAEACNNLGVLIRETRADEAHDLFARAAAAKPGYLEARFNFALSCMMRGDLAGAAAEFRAVLAIDPTNGRAATDLSSVLRGLGEFDDALAMAERGVMLLPGDPATHNNLGNVLLECGHLEKAMVCYERALSLNPEYPEAINNLGTTYRGLRQPEKAIPLFLRALDLRPGYIDAMHNLGLGLPPGMPGAEIIESRLRAEVARDPESAAALAVLAVFLQEAGRFDEARVVAEDVNRRDPRNTDALTVLGICAAEAVQPEKAIEYYDRALEINPRLGVTRWNRAIAYLALGRYEEGWREYESRWSLVNMAFDRRLPDRAEWNGEAVDGRTILVYTEQGLGDAIQFARFGAELKRRWNPRIVVECDASLVSLFHTCDWVDGVVARGSERPAFDTHVALLSLPRILEATLDRIPTEPAFAPVDRPIARRVSRAPGVLNVGIVWGGRSPNPALARRSVPLETLAPLARIPNVRLHSLQVGDTSGQLERCSFRNAINDLAPYIGDFVDTAAAMRAMDLVITIDTSVAHLAGAIGVPVWVMLMRNADWRWLIDREDSPWYPSARLFRQQAPGEWRPVVRAVVDTLEAIVGRDEAGADAAPMVELPSQQRDADGIPRFTLTIPLTDLAHDQAFVTYSQELAGDGVDPEARNFLDAEVKPTDLVIDVDGPWGITALGAATAPSLPAGVVAVVASDEQADIVAGGARSAHRAAPLHTLVRDETLNLDAIIEWAAGASRVIVRAHRAGDVLSLLPSASASLTRGGIAAFIWNLHGAAGEAPAWGDQLALQALTSLGFEHFEMVEDENGALLDALSEAPTSRTVFSLVVERFQSDTPAEPESGLKILGLDWTVSATSGWGLYGLNLARRVIETGVALPAPSVPPRLDELSDEQRELLMPMQVAHEEFTETLSGAGEHATDVSFLMLRSLGNGLFISPQSATINAPRNVGVVFFESTDLDHGAIARANLFDRIIAGSTWNAEVLRGHGVQHVTTVLQGVDTSAFGTRPRKTRRDGEFVVFSGGKLEYRKGQDIVIAAFRELVKRHPEAKLMFAWHNHWPKTMGEIEAAGLVEGLPSVDAMGNIDFTGWLERNGIPAANVIDLGLRTNAEMAAAIMDADVALFTNRAEGGTNLVAMECLAAGVPTILSANTGHLDLVDDARCFALRDQRGARTTEWFRGVDGWGESSVEEVLATLETVYGDPAEAARRADNAKEWMRDLSWDRQIDRLVESIRDLM